MTTLKQLFKQRSTEILLLIKEWGFMVEDLNGKETPKLLGISNCLTKGLYFLLKTHPKLAKENHPILSEYNRLSHLTAILSDLCNCKVRLFTETNLENKGLINQAISLNSIEKLEGELDLAKLDDDDFNYISTYRIEGAEDQKEIKKKISSILDIKPIVIDESNGKNPFPFFQLQNSTVCNITVFVDNKNIEQTAKDLLTQVNNIKGLTEAIAKLLELRKEKNILEEKNEIEIKENNNYNYTNKLV